MINGIAKSEELRKRQRPRSVRLLDGYLAAGNTIMGRRRYPPSLPSFSFNPEIILAHLDDIHAVRLEVA